MIFEGVVKERDEVVLRHSPFTEPLRGWSSAGCWCPRARNVEVAVICPRSRVVDVSIARRSLVFRPRRGVSRLTALPFGMKQLAALPDFGPAANKEKT